MQRLFRAWLAVALTAIAIAASAQTPITLDDALRRARENAPAVIAARARIEEARSELVGASALFRDNPTAETSIGRRTGDGRDFRDRELQLSQNFELGGRRSIRIDRAEASIVRETAASAEIERAVVADAARAFVQTLAAQERMRLTERSREIARQLLDATERRHRAGDVPDLDVNAARIAAARADSDVLAAEAARAIALGDLRAALGLQQTEAITVVGDLRSRRPPSLAELLAQAAQRPELRVLAAERGIAEQDLRLGRSYTLPDLGARVAMQTEGGEDVVMAGIGVTIPLFQRGQELRAFATARARRAELELEAARLRIEAEVGGAFEAWQRAEEALTTLEQRALPAITDNEALSLRSYEAGQISLPELLVIRREILDAREAYIQRLLDAAEAAIEAEARAGALR